MADPDGQPRPALWDVLIGPYRGSELSDLSLPNMPRRRMAERIKDFDGRAGSLATDNRLSEHLRYRYECWRYLSSSVFRDDDVRRFAQSVAGHGTTGGGWIWLLGYFAIVSVGRAFGRGTVARLDRALRETECPDCRYSLIASPHRVAGAICPTVCPECGVAWPLLPPRLRYPVAGLNPPSMDA